MQGGDAQGGGEQGFTSQGIVLQGDDTQELGAHGPE